MSKVVCVLYPDPVDGQPTTYARDEVPVLDGYPGGQTLPTPHAARLHAGRACSEASRASSACAASSRPGPPSRRHRRQGRPDSTFERELADADIVISQPFWPAYLTAERVAKAPNLKLAITAGIGSDHVDLQAADRAPASRWRR